MRAVGVRLQLERDRQRLQAIAQLGPQVQTEEALLLVVEVLQGGEGERPLAEVQLRDEHPGHPVEVQALEGQPRHAARDGPRVAVQLLVHEDGGV